MEELGPLNDQVSATPVDVQSAGAIGDKIYAGHAVQHGDNSSHVDMNQDHGIRTDRFGDFITPDHSAGLSIKGRKVVLDLLNTTLSRGAFVQRVSGSIQEFSPYSPLVTAVNCVLAALHEDPITEHDITQLQYAPWFPNFVAQYQTWADFDVLPEFNQPASPTAGSMHMIFKAISRAKRLPQIYLGSVVLDRDLVITALAQAHVSQDSHVAWLYQDLRNGSLQFFGIGHPPMQQKQEENEEGEEGEEDEDEQVEGEEDESTSTPRKTAAHVLAQQMPLPAGLSEGDILGTHFDRLQYNNLLKVALKHSNPAIAAADPKVAKIKTNGDKPSVTGVVKRINTACDFIELTYGITSGAFRAKFDRVRKANGIRVRSGKETVSEAELVANGPKIDAAMAWVIRGGPDRVAVVPAGPATVVSINPTITATATTATTAPGPATTPGLVDAANSTSDVWPRAEYAAASDVSTSRQINTFVAPHNNPFNYYTAPSSNESTSNHISSTSTSTRFQGPTSAPSLNTGSQMDLDDIDTGMRDLPTSSGNATFNADLELILANGREDELNEFLMNIPHNFSYQS